MELSLLDLYVLAMFDRGCETPYDLHRDANLSLGAISPSVSRLFKEKLVTRVDEVNATRRPRHRYALTRSGKEQARAGWKRVLHSGEVPGDLDSVLRLADLAHYYKGSSHHILKLLDSAGKQRLAKSEQLSITVRDTTANSSYGHMRNRIDSARLHAEGTALVGMAEEFGRKSSRGKKSAGQRSPK
jgi:DNA-binding PadR family transcriptional regulator